MRKIINTNHTKEKIMQEAWRLFLEKGYEETTIAEILSATNTSRSTFYHHFRGKDEVLFTLAYSYDANYEHWLTHHDSSSPYLQQLASFCSFVFTKVESSPYHQLYPAIYSLQVDSKNTRHILNPRRTYYQILRQLLKSGQESGEISTTFSYAELTEMISSLQIGLTYTWCLNQERFSLVHYGNATLLPFLSSLSVTSP